MAAWSCDFDHSLGSSRLPCTTTDQVLGFWGARGAPHGEARADFNNNVGNPWWALRTGITLLLPR